MSDLRGRVVRLEQGIGARSGRGRWRALLEPHFTAPVFDGHREALLDALCGANPAFHFEAGEGPDRGQYFIWWWSRSGPPVVMRILCADDGES